MTFLAGTTVLLEECNVFLVILSKSERPNAVALSLSLYLHAAVPNWISTTSDWLG